MVNTFRETLGKLLIAAGALGGMYTGIYLILLKILDVFYTDDATGTFLVNLAVEEIASIVGMWGVIFLGIKLIRVSSKKR